MLQGFLNLRRCAFLLLPLLAFAVSGCGKSGDQETVEWPSYGFDGTESRFSPASEIDLSNVKTLGLAWSLDLPGETALEASPLQIDRTIYFSGGMATIYAVDAVSGKLKWTYDPGAGDRMDHFQRMAYPVNRGVAYGDGLVFVATRDGRMVAVDAKTGKLRWDRPFLLKGDKSTSTGAPRYFKGKVIIGNSGAEVLARGYVTALDAKSGRLAWRFFTVPGNPAVDKDETTQIAAKTWSGEWWKYGGGGTPWNAMTFDEELNQVLIGTGNAGSYAAELRAKGMQDNLFVASVVAIDPDTGKYKWHYQYNPLEVWDYKATMDIVLADLDINGHKRKILMQAPSNGFFYVIDRTNGKIISAEKIGKVTWASRIDLKTGRPVEVPEARYTDAAFTVYPGMPGAHNWQAMAYNPQTGLVYIPYIQTGTRFERSTAARDGLLKERPGFFVFGVSPMTVIDPKDPRDGRGSLLAWDPVSQKLRWRVDYENPWNGGLMTTAANLVFQGLESGEFVAYDAASGKRLWSFDAQMGIIAPPITYTIGGRQYVSVLAGYGGGGAGGGAFPGKGVAWSFQLPRRLLTFALDAKGTLPKLSFERVTPSTDFIDDPKRTFDTKLAASAEILYGSTCGECHGAVDAPKGAAPDLRASPMAADRATLGQLLKSGALASRGMPKFDDLTEREIDALHAYIGLNARNAKRGFAVSGKQRPVMGH